MRSRASATLPDGNLVMILLDLKVLRLDGVHVWRQLKAYENLPSVPVVILTSLLGQSHLSVIHLSARNREGRPKMNSQIQEVDMGFTQERFPMGIHMCLIFDEENYRRRIVTEFLAAGLKHGEQVRYMTDINTAQDVLSWFSEIGIEIPQLGPDEPFVMFSAENAYCPNGRFDPIETIERMKCRYDKAKNLGYSGTRGCGEMSWALKGIPGSDRLIEFEALISAASETHHFLGICQYDARLFDGATLLNVLKVHPYIIAQRQIVRNPFYLRAEEFLKDLASRRA